MNKWTIAAVGLALALGGAVGPVRAQYFPGQGYGPSNTENIEGVTVAGKGVVTAKPNLVEIDVEVSAASELTADAIVKYRDARRRLREAFTALKLENVAVEERGLLVDQKGMMNNRYFFGYQPNTRNKTEVQLERKLIVKGSNIRKLDEDALLQMVAKLLDVAQDAGAQLGHKMSFDDYYWGWNPRQQTGLVRFILDDFDKLEEEAYEKAIADARAHAERLARLSQVELGPIVAVRELVVPGERNAENPTARKRLEMAKFQEIPVRVELLVRFQIHPRSDNLKRQATSP